MAATVWSRPSRRSKKEAAWETARGMLNALRTTARKGASRYRRHQRRNFANKLRSKRGGERRQRKMQLARAAALRHRLLVVVIA
jgi:hypothetical protein